MQLVQLTVEPVGWRALLAGWDCTWQDSRPSGPYEAQSWRGVIEILSLYNSTSVMTANALLKEYFSAHLFIVAI